jgi:GNAT superfamily N-acetyltransferase
MRSSRCDGQTLGTLWLLNPDEPARVDLKPRIAAAFRRVETEEAPVLARAMGFDDQGEVLRRFSMGRRCYAARVEGILTTYGWVSFHAEEIGELGLRIRLSEREAYIWDCATLPAYRGQHLFPALLSHIATQVRAEGLRQLWIGVNSNNPASQRGVARAGFRPVADIVEASTPTMRSLWVRGRPGVPEHLVTRARRALLGDD